MGNKGKLIISACLAASATYFIEMIDVFVLSRPPFADLKERIMLSIALLLIFLASGYIIALLEILARWLVVERFGVGIFFARLGRSVRDRGEGGVYFVSVFYAVVAFFVLFVPANFCLTHHLLLTRHNKMMISFSQTALSIGVLLLCVFIAGIVFIFFKNLAGRSALKMETYRPVRFILRWMGIPLILFIGVALAVFFLNLWWLKIVLDFRWFGYIVVFFILQLVIYRLVASRSRAVS